MLRREFVFNGAFACLSVPAVLSGGVGLGHIERIDRVLAGKDTDRPPFSFWCRHDGGTPEVHARRTLEFHGTYRTDLVKVMNPDSYPAPSGRWYEIPVSTNPFPCQIRTLEIIRGPLMGRAYFVDTLFSPWTVAETLSSTEEVLQLKEENPQALLDALDAITRSEINHVKRSLAAGAAGIFFAVPNAHSQALAISDYAAFCRPFDKLILDAISNAKLSILHLHVESAYLNQFRGFRVPVVNYSMAASRIPVSLMRRMHDGVIAAGIDERTQKDLADGDLRAQWRVVVEAAGPRLILTSGCTLEDGTSLEELSRLSRLLRT